MHLEYFLLDLVESEEECSTGNGEPSNDEESDQSQTEDPNSGNNPARQGNQMIKRLGRGEGHVGAWLG